MPLRKKFDESFIKKTAIISTFLFFSSFFLLLSFQNCGGMHTKKGQFASTYGIFQSVSGDYGESFAVSSLSRVPINDSGNASIELQLIPSNSNEGETLADAGTNLIKAVSGMEDLGEGAEANMNNIVPTYNVGYRIKLEDPQFTLFPSNEDDEGATSGPYTGIINIPGPLSEGEPSTLASLKIYFRLCVNGMSAPSDPTALIAALSQNGREVTGSGDQLDFSEPICTESISTAVLPVLIYDPNVLDNISSDEDNTSYVDPVLSVVFGGANSDKVVLWLYRGVGYPFPPDSDSGNTYYSYSVKCENEDVQVLESYNGAPSTDSDGNVNGLQSLNIVIPGSEQPKVCRVEVDYNPGGNSMSYSYFGDVAVPATISSNPEDPDPIDDGFQDPNSGSTPADVDMGGDEDPPEEADGPASISDIDVQEVGDSIMLTITGDNFEASRSSSAINAFVFHVGLTGNALSSQNWEYGNLAWDFSDRCPLNGTTVLSWSNTEVRLSVRKRSAPTGKTYLPGKCEVKITTTRSPNGVSQVINISGSSNGEPVPLFCTVNAGVSPFSGGCCPHSTKDSVGVCRCQNGETYIRENSRCE